jgi:hypothetical protein
LTAYSAELKAQGQTKDLFKAVSEKWKSMTEEDKKPYSEKAANLKKIESR